MVYKLEVKDYEKVRPVFSELSEFNYALLGLLDGLNPGWILADSPENPQSALASTVEGYCLAGDFQDDTFIREINAYLVENFYNDEDIISGDEIFACVYPKAWADKMTALFHPREPLTLIVRHYLCTELKYTDWRNCLPDAFILHRIDKELLENPTLNIPDHIHGWINNNWGTQEHYLKHGFGFCIVHENMVSQWSLADCVSKDGRCEIGIWSLPTYRRRGLAAITAAASTEYALSHGFVKVGWHCLDDNVGSYKTAEKVGFYYERSDTNYFCKFSSLDQVAAKAWHSFQHGQYQETIALCEQLFARSDNCPDYTYHIAAQANAAEGNSKQAIKYLNIAIDRGWHDLEYSKNQEQFVILHGSDEWETVLARFKEN